VAVVQSALNNGTISNVNKFWCCLNKKKGVRKLENFSDAISLTIFKQLFNMLATQNKNHNQNWPFLTKDMNFLSFYSV